MVKITGSSSKPLFSVNEDFKTIFLSTLDEILEEGDQHPLESFLSRIFNKLNCECTAVVWSNPKTRLWDIGFAIHSKRGKKQLAQCVDLDGSFQEIVSHLDSSPQTHRSIFYDAANAKGRRDFVLVKIPRPYVATAGLKSIYVLVVDPASLTSPISDLTQHRFETFCLSAIVSTWIRKIYNPPNEIVPLYNMAPTDVLPVEDRSRAMKRYIECFAPFLDIREIVGIRLSIGKEYTDVADAMDKAVEDLKQPMYSDQKDIAAELLYWCKWRGEVQQAPPVANRNDLLQHFKRLRSLALASSLPSNGLDPKWPLAYFLSEVLRQDVFCDRYVLPYAGNDQELVHAMSCLAHVVHYLFARQPMQEETVRSIIWLVSEYAHGVLQLPERIDLTAHLLHAARGEPALHMVKNYYRDHFAHVLEVCFLGHFLLDLKLPNKKRLWQQVARHMGYNTNAHREILRLWYLAALIHDMGYGIDLLKGAHKLLKFFKNSPLIEAFSVDLERTVSALSGKVATEIGGYSAEDKPGEDHGVISAIHLVGLIKSIAKDDPKHVALKEYWPAVSAIALHNNRKHAVLFSKDPLGFLLILCDQIQEWNRPRLNWSVAPIQMLTWMAGQEISVEPRKGPFRSVTINVKRDRDSFRLASSARNSLLSFTLEYSHGTNHNAEVFNLWIDASCNFQRLDFAGLKINIDIHYVTPKYENPRTRACEWQFDRLKRAATETHMNFLHPWFPTQAKRKGVTNGAVEYSNSGLCTPPKEHLVLHLKNLTSETRITKDIDYFRQRLTQWKEYNEDRDFEGDYAPVIPE